MGVGWRLMSLFCLPGKKEQRSGMKHRKIHCVRQHRVDYAAVQAAVEAEQLRRERSQQQRWKAQQRLRRANRRPMGAAPIDWNRYVPVVLVLLLWGAHCAWGQEGATNPDDDPGLITRTKDRPPTDDDWRMLRAYDCSRPSIVEAVQLPAPGTCPLPDVRVTDVTAKTFAVLQDAQYLRFPAHSCVASETRLPFFCGSASHQTILGTLVRVQEPVRLTHDECRKLVEDGEYPYEGVKITGIPMNATTQRTVEVVGKTVHYTDWDVNCEGTRPTREGINNVVDVRVIQFQLGRHWLARGEEDTVLVPRTTTKLPCKFHSLHCRSQESGTYYWDPMGEAASCTLHHVRFTSGKVYGDSDGAATYISQDASAIRLLLGREVTKCGRPVRETDHGRLFVSETLDDDYFSKELDPMELSPVLYGSVQTAYVEAKVAAHIENVIAELKQEACRARSTHSEGRYDQLAADQRAALHGSTAALGKGRFATAAGEAWYTYGCAAILVRAENSDTCYSALPVSLTKDDMEAHFAERKESPSFGTQFYVEPLTHRLTTRASPRPCDKVLLPAYKNHHGGWFHAGPDLNRAATPRQLSGLSPSIINAQYNHTNFGKGGLYTAEQVRKMDVWA